MERLSIKDLPAIILLSFLMLFDNGGGENTTVAGNSTAENSTHPGMNPLGGPVSSDGTLWCYECTETYDEEYDPLQAPCQLNVSTVTLRQCNPEYKYCFTTVSRQWGWTPTGFTRGCITDCQYGCKFNGFAISDEVCTSCCQKNACNTDSSSTCPKSSMVLAASSFIIISLSLT